MFNKIFLLIYANNVLGIKLNWNLEREEIVTLKGRDCNFERNLRRKLQS